MLRSAPRTSLGALGLALALAGCAPRSGPAPAAPATPSAAAPTGAANPGYPHVQADVDFMNGMIAHHGQALVMAGWAPSHGASDAVQRMAERIVVGQADEIHLMQRWLKDRNLPAPDPSAPMDHSMAGMDHSAMPGMDHSKMPGMLTPAQMSQLDAARGATFDRMFLTFMIQHHSGALKMVDQLFGTNGAGQNETVFRLASDIYADQSTEIDRMQKMLAALPSEGRAP